MTKKLFAVLLIAMTATAASAQLLYKVSGNGLDYPSYILGKHELANVGVLYKISGLNKAILETDQVYGEMAWNSITNPDSLKALKQGGKLTGGKTLKTVLTDEQYNKLDDFLIKKEGVGLASATVNKKYGDMTPAALALQLNVLLYQLNHLGEYDPTSSFDQYVQAIAKKNSMPICGFEDIPYQVQLLYQGAPMDKQVAQLMCVVNNADAVAANLEAVMKAFKAQDLDALLAATIAKISDSCYTTDADLDALIYARNAAWAAQMPAIMESKSTFFTLSAEHLPGSKGVLQLLKDAGYTVEAVQ